MGAGWVAQALGRKGPGMDLNRPLPRAGDIACSACVAVDAGAAGVPLRPLTAVPPSSPTTDQGLATGAGAGAFTRVAGVPRTAHTLPCGSVAPAMPSTSHPERPRAARTARGAGVAIGTDTEAGPEAVAVARARRPHTPGARLVAVGPPVSGGARPTGGGPLIGAGRAAGAGIAYTQAIGACAAATAGRPCLGVSGAREGAAGPREARRALCAARTSPKPTVRAGEALTQARRGVAAAVAVAGLTGSQPRARNETVCPRIALSAGAAARALPAVLALAMAVARGGCSARAELVTGEAKHPNAATDAGLAPPQA